MEKRKLSAIPRPIATPEMMEVADRLGGMRHIVTAELIDDKKILLLNFFEIQALKKGKTEAAFRTFLSHDDYITQDLKTSKTKWLTASFAGMYNFSLMDYVWNHQENKSSHRLNVFMRSDEELEIVKGFFKEYALPDDEYSPWIEIHRFQQEVLDKRLEEKHKKETDKIDAVMDPIKEAPKEFFDWVWDTGMSFARYLIYKEVEKGKALCECTHCKEIGIVDRKNIRLRNNEKGICPFCGSRVTIKAKGRMPAQTQDERWFVYVDPTKDGFVFRYFKAHQSMRSDSYVDMSRYSGYQTGKVNVKGNTIYEILGLTKVNTRVLQAVDGNHDVLRLLQVAQKIGLQFKPEQIQEYYETFGCNTDLLQQANRKTTLHKIVKYITKECENYPLGDQGGCWKYSYMRYTEREDPRIERKRNMAKDWLEYLNWCKDLKYDLDNMFIYMPKNFKKVHDRTAKEHQELMDRQAAKEKARREREAKRRMEQTKKAMSEIFKENKDCKDAFQIKGKGLLLVVPKTADEIKAEGAALHHCVGGYVDRVARGETNIFFVRKSAEPDKPYFTMEWNNNHIIQCRGSHNCGMPPEVEAFVKAFEKKMQDTINENKEKEMRRCG